MEKLVSVFNTGDKQGPHTLGAFREYEEDATAMHQQPPLIAPWLILFPTLLGVVGVLCIINSKMHWVHLPQVATWSDFWVGVGFLAAAFIAAFVIAIYWIAFFATRK